MKFTTATLALVAALTGTVFAAEELGALEFWDQQFKKGNDVAVYAYEAECREYI